ncbi:ATP-binding protein [Maridesulfovibrio sp.]|uniref:ATP-binding protein n=1 Tax=unclassified Maridesulfovibrio TaxID=2794999 RepID=UPI003B005103
MHELAIYLKENESELMERILHYAKIQGYAEYTSTLLEAWRVSIVGLSDAIIQGLDIAENKLPEFSPEDRFENSLIADFGIKEARLHRKRGISLQMFLGLYKYYRYVFEEVVMEMDVADTQREFYKKFVERVFDLIEIAFCSEWSGLNSDNVILELQHSNREMTNEKNKYLTLFESISVPVFLVDAHGNVGNLNYAAAVLLGIETSSGAGYYGDDYVKEHLPIGKKITSILPWLSIESNEFLTGDLPKRSFEKNVFIGGKASYFMIHFARMKDVSGKFEGGIFIVQDITNRKDIEFQLAQARKMESVGQLASGIAHEINTPIHFVGHNLDFIEESLSSLLSGKGKDLSLASDDLQYLKQELPSVIKESKDGIRRVSRIVKAFNKFAHPEHADKSVVKLNEIIANVIEITRNEWKHVAEITKDYDPNLLLVDAIYSELNQIILNILMNAIHAVRAKFGENHLGEISVRTQNIGRFVEVAIKDNGCGITEDIQHRIYDPFFTTKDIGEGTGQGLYIVHTLTTKNGGEIRYSSEKDVGTTFFIHFPAHNKN